MLFFATIHSNYFSVREQLQTPNISLSMRPWLRIDASDTLKIPAKYEKKILGKRNSCRYFLYRGEIFPSSFRSLELAIPSTISPRVRRRTFHNFQLLPEREEKWACKAEEMVDAGQTEILCEPVRAFNRCVLLRG